MNKVAVVTFGRFNPPHLGHLELLKKMQSEVNSTNGIPMVFMSHLVEPKKNPLTVEEKFEYFLALFPQYKKFARVERAVRNPIDVLKFLDLEEGYNEVIFVAGSDRVSEYRTLFDKYNGVLYRLKIQVVSSGQRDADSNDISGASSTKMREYAKAGDLRGFRKMLPQRATSDLVSDLFHTIRLRMNVVSAIRESQKTGIPLLKFLAKLSSRE